MHRRSCVLSWWLLCGVLAGGRAAQGQFPHLPPLPLPPGLPQPPFFGQQEAPISGQVLSLEHGPVLGVTVSLVHPVLGRVCSVFSDKNGAYAFVKVSARPDPYYIEAYWGTKLLFRDTLNYHGGSLKYDVKLP